MWLGAWTQGRLYYFLYLQVLETVSLKQETILFGTMKLSSTYLLGKVVICNSYWLICNN